MIWQNIHYLWFLLLIPALAAGIWWYRRKLHKKREQYFEDSLFEKLRRGYWDTGETIQSASLYLGLLFLAIALAGPKIGTEVREVQRQGVDLLVALDLSASMNAEDIRPSRLDKAKYEISRLVDRLEGDRVGLVVFTGDAYLQSPMTLDYSAMRLFLDIVDSDQMPSTSTDFSAAMETARQAFESIDEESGSTEAAKVMLILSDGENHGEGYSQELEALTSMGVSIYTVGIGTTAGANIPLYDASGSLIGNKRDAQGQVVTTRLEPQVLRDIAGQGDGEYYAIETGGESIDGFLGRLDELQQGEFASQEYADYKNQYQWLAGIGLAFLVVSMGVSNYRKR
ncbi:MAG: VWA domain-containing protein [Balneolaceae bacterium]|nr:VWA domain-containing protein [Balneolaceae bacterium]